MHLITNPSDIWYLTGVRPHDPGEILIIYKEKRAESNSCFVVDKNQNALLRRTGKENRGIVFCDPRTAALFDAARFETIDDRKKWGTVFEKYRKLKTDPDFLTQTLREKIEGYGVSLTMKKSPIVQKRIIKSDHEIELLRESQSLNKKVYEMILPFLIPGVAEDEIARKIQILQLELGASGPSFPPIVAFGENTAVPHHHPGSRKLLSNDLILLDMGLIYQGYCSDMTRCTQIQSTKYIELRSLPLDMPLGISPVQNDGFFDEIYELLQNVTNSIISWAKPGMKVADLDKKTRKMLGKYEQYFTHSLGHGVGIDIHEAPHISMKSKEILEPGMIITIEPGMYIPGKYGARYEEMCLVTEQGLEVL